MANGAVMLNGVSNSGNTVANIDTGASGISFYTINTSGARDQLNKGNWANNDEIAATVCYETA